MLIKDQCLYADEVENIGLGMFVSNTVLYGIGSLYLGVAGVIASQAAWYEETDYYYSSYSYSGYSEEAIAFLAPQSSVFVAFGCIAQIPKIMQAQYLQELGEEPSTGLLAAGWLLYGLSIGTSTLHILSFIADEYEFSTTTAIINAGLLGSAFAVHVAGYAAQTTKLRAAVDKHFAAPRSERLSVAPYAYCIGKQAGAGVMVSF